jgi:hypothetical protein
MNRRCRIAKYILPDLAEMALLSHFLPRYCVGAILLLFASPTKAV